MTRRFDLIVFDWDGTLMDSTSHIAESFRRACQDLALPIPPPEQARWIIGLGLAPALQRILPQLPAADYPRLSAAYRTHFLSGDAVLPLFPGTTALIRALRAADHRLAVATGKSRQGLERALDQSGLRQQFDGTRCADESFAKPHPAMLLELIDRLGASADRTLMVGDTVHDLQMAANAGVRAVALAHGAHAGDELRRENPLAVLDDTLALAHWLHAGGQLPVQALDGIRQAHAHALTDAAGAVRP